MRNRSANKYCIVVGAIIGVMGTNAAGAMTSISLDLDTEFSGAVPPDNPNTPWVTAEFMTAGNDVLFTLTATTNLTDPEKVTGFYFNFDDSLDVQLLNFGFIGLSGTFDFPPAINLSKDAYQADGDGKYDVRFDFSTSGTVANTFGAGDSLTYLISYTTPITDQEFAHQSAPAGGHGPFYAAAHVQSTGPSNGDSGWIAAEEVAVIPEPTSIALAALGLAGFGKRSRRT